MDARALLRPGPGIVFSFADAMHSAPAGLEMAWTRRGSRLCPRRLHRVHSNVRAAHYSDGSRSPNRTAEAVSGSAPGRSSARAEIYAGQAIGDCALRAQPRAA